MSPRFSAAVGAALLLAAACVALATASLAGTSDHEFDCGCLEYDACVANSNCWFGVRDCGDGGAARGFCEYRYSEEATCEEQLTAVAAHFDSIEPTTMGDYVHECTMTGTCDVDTVGTWSGMYDMLNDDGRVLPTMFGCEGLNEDACMREGNACAWVTFDCGTEFAAAICTERSFEDESFTSTGSSGTSTSSSGTGGGGTETFNLYDYYAVLPVMTEYNVTWEAKSDDAPLKGIGTYKTFYINGEETATLVLEYGHSAVLHMYNTCDKRFYFTAAPAGNGAAPIVGGISYSGDNTGDGTGCVGDDMVIDVDELYEAAGATEFYYGATTGSTSGGMVRIIGAPTTTTTTPFSDYVLSCDDFVAGAPAYLDQVEATFSQSSWLDIAECAVVVTCDDQSSSWDGMYPIGVFSISDDEDCEPVDCGAYTGGSNNVEACSQQVGCAAHYTWCEDGYEWTDCYAETDGCMVGDGTERKRDTGDEEECCFYEWKCFDGSEVAHSTWHEMSCCDDVSTSPTSSSGGDGDGDGDSETQCDEYVCNAYVYDSYVAEDTYVDSDAPDDNFAAENVLLSTKSARWALMRFWLPCGDVSAIASAELNMRARKLPGKNKVQYVYVTDDAGDVDFSAVTWNTKPAKGNMVAEFLAVIDEYVAVDISGFFFRQSLAASCEDATSTGMGHVDVVVQASNAKNYKFKSAESNHPPFLAVAYNYDETM